MDNPNENPDSQNGETADELEGLDADALKEKYHSLDEKFKEIDSKNRQLFERLQKEKGFERDEDGNWIKIIEKKSEKKPDPKKPDKSSEIDYGQLAFHNSKSESIKIEHDEDIEFLQKTLEASGKTQNEVLTSKWFQAELKERQEARAVKDATPSATRRSTTNVRDKVDYWIDKPFNEVPENLKRAVLDKKVEQQKREMTFSSQPVVFG